MSNIQEFKNNPESFSEFRKTILLRTIPTMTIAAGVGITIACYNTNSGDGTFKTLPFIIPFIIVLMGYSINKGIKRQKVMFDSYRLTVTESSFVRNQFNTPMLTLPFSDVTAISKNKNGGFIIKGTNANANIIIAPYLENFNQLETLLNTISPIAAKNNQPVFEKFSGLLGLLTMGLMAVVYLSHNKIWVGLSGTVLLSIMLYSFFKLQKNKNIDYTSKKSTWIMFLVVASVLGVMTMKLFFN